MDIVKQRRKRLLAWILTIALCVGVWQGSVYATEGTEEGSVSGNEVVEEADIPEGNVMSDLTVKTEDSVMSVSTGEISMVSLEDSETGAGTEVGSETDPEIKKGYNISVKYEDDAKLVDSFKGTYSYTGVNGEVNGATSIVDIVEGSSLTLAGSSDGGEHELLSWSICNSGGTELESGDGKTIMLATNSWSSVPTLKVYWQKILDVIIGNETYQCKQTAETMNSTTVPVPEVSKDNICREGKFFSKWADESDGKIAVNFGDSIYEKRTIELKGVYDSMTVPASGTFALTNDNYVLDSSGTWKVNDDGYEYEGGISFYGGGKEYNFVMTPRAN